MAWLCSAGWADAIELTEAGRLFLDEARAVLARAQAAELALSEIAGVERGALTIYASRTIASYWLPLRLVGFHLAHPRITINLVDRNTAEVARAVQDGSADLGLVEGRVEADDLVQQVVARDRMTLVVAPAHPWATRRSMKGSDLPAGSWVLRERGSGTRAQFEDVLKRCDLSVDQLNVVLELPSNEGVRAAVEAGAGATMISRLAVETPSSYRRQLGHTGGEVQ